MHSVYIGAFNKEKLSERSLTALSINVNGDKVGDVMDHVEHTLR